MSIPKSVHFELPIKEVDAYEVKVMESTDNSNTSSDMSSIIKQASDSETSCLTYGNIALDESQEETKNGDSNSTLIVVAEKSTESSNQSDSSMVGAYTVVAIPLFPTLEVYPGMFFDHQAHSHDNAFYVHMDVDIIDGMTTSTYRVYLFACVEIHSRNRLGDSNFINIDSTFSGYCGASQEPGK
jgi:hypothetical protein